MTLKVLLREIPIRQVTCKGIPFKSLDCRKKDWDDLLISHVTCDSRQVAEGSLFIAISGQTHNGHDFIEDACLKASALILETSFFKKQAVPSTFQGPVVWVDNTRWAFGQIGANFYKNPGKKTKCIGVTGTNGKTTSVYILASLLEGMGEKVGVLSTIDHHIGQKTWPAQMTTPSPLDLHQRISQMSEYGMQVLAMEVSSHALVQHRVDALTFSSALWTNLTPDHLDYHGSMEAYFDAKKRLFSKTLMKKDSLCAINIDDEWGQRLLKETSVKAITYGYNPSDLQIVECHSTLQALEVTLLYEGKTYRASLKLIGQHNALNFTGCVALLIGMGYPLADILKACHCVKNVPGRLEQIVCKKSDGKTFYGFIDYAHTSDALKQTLQSLRQVQIAPQAKIITVFGCGGDRDQTKRPVMAQIAQKYSDIVVITSDNPRNQDPFVILRDIESGLTRPLDQKTCFSIVDRRQAILKAVSLTQQNDFLVIAGKGHETYQVLKEKTVAFSDRDELQKALKFL